MLKWWMHLGPREGTAVGPLFRLDEVKQALSITDLAFVTPLIEDIWDSVKWVVVEPEAMSLCLDSGVEVDWEVFGASEVRRMANIVRLEWAV